MRRAARPGRRPTRMPRGRDGAPQRARSHGPSASRSRIPSTRLPGGRAGRAPTRAPRLRRPRPTVRRRRAPRSGPTSTPASPPQAPPGGRRRSRTRSSDRFPLRRHPAPQPSRGPGRLRRPAVASRGAARRAQPAARPASRVGRPAWCPGTRGTRPQSPPSAPAVRERRPRRRLYVHHGRLRKTPSLPSSYRVPKLVPGSAGSIPSTSEVNLSPTSSPTGTSRRPGWAAEAAAAPPVRSVAALLAALVAALAFVTGADAAVVTAQDNQGRTMTFDVRDPNANVDWYASLLRSAAHGNEISNVTIRIVGPEDVEVFCGAEAAACYSRSRSRPLIVVPSGQGGFVASTMLHEYGHHLDTSWSVAGVPELNGTPVWWQARGMAGLLNAGPGGVRLLARLEPQHRRDLRRGLRVHPSRRRLRDPVAAATRPGAQDRAAGRARRRADDGAAARCDGSRAARDHPPRHARAAWPPRRFVRPARPRPPRHVHGDRVEPQPRRNAGAGADHLQRPHGREPAAAARTRREDDRPAQSGSRPVRRPTRQHERRSPHLHAQHPARHPVRDLGRTPSSARPSSSRSSALGCHSDRQRSRDLLLLRRAGDHRGDRRLGEQACDRDLEHRPPAF